MKQRDISFGTDGVRGVANRGLLPEDSFQMGLAAARLFGGNIVVGRDTRLSGGMLSSALMSGIASGGADVTDLGIVPTPGVAALARKLDASAAVVVSASHNPYPDNGIKFLSVVSKAYMKILVSTNARTECSPTLMRLIPRPGLCVRK